MVSVTLGRSSDVCVFYFSDRFSFKSLFIIAIKFCAITTHCVKLVSGQQFCGGKITKAQGEIKTPNWPEKKYPPATSCSWLITVEPDMVGSILAPSVQMLLNTHRKTQVVI